MGLFDGIRKWLSGEPKEEEVEISEPVTPVIQAQTSQPANLDKREAWRQRRDICSGSRTKAENVRQVAPRTRFGQCPVCKRGDLSVTTNGNTWPHKGEPRTAHVLLGGK